MRYRRLLQDMECYHDALKASFCWNRTKSCQICRERQTIETFFDLVKQTKKKAVARRIERGQVTKRFCTFSPKRIIRAPILSLAKALSSMDPSKSTQPNAAINQVNSACRDMTPQEM